LMLVAMLLATTSAVVSCGDGASNGDQLRILVTNDDGVAAAGIDALVRALVADGRNDVVVCAPNGNRSGSGDMTGPSPQCGNLQTSRATTAGGYPATSIDGCPADAVNYALDNLYPAGSGPHVVLAGINAGQNLSEVVATRLSGTVGAAKTAARRGVPALASSQGLPAAGGSFDYPAGAQAVLAWLADRRATLVAGDTTPTDVDSVNIPSCSAGHIRGTITGLPLAPTIDGALGAQDCESTLEDPRDDVQAFINGFITLSAVPLD